jgi:ribosomal protein L11 methyltransferase
VKWLEVSLTLESELAEAVADLLARVAPGGVSVEATTIADDPSEGHAVGPVTVRAFLAVDATLEAKRRQVAEGLWHLSRIQPLPEPRFRPMDDEDWAEAWKQHYHPIRIGRRLLILPAWLPPPPGDDLLLILDPGMAFGTGTHPTTQLVLAVLEERLRPGQDLIDLGCGSGILSIAAARLNAGHILALDTDPTAVEVAGDNLRRNQVDDRVRVELGSLDRLRQGATPIQADLVLANILASVLEGMIRDGLGEVLRPDGLLLLSGILDHQLDGLLDVARQHGLESIEVRADGDWRAVVLKRRPPP